MSQRVLRVSAGFFRTAVGPAQAAAFPTWTPKQSIDVMDRGGVEKAMLSLSLPGVWLGDVQQGAVWLGW